jgi:hypothetical protein
MTKKIALSILFALGLALTLAGPAAARPPLCTCPFCAVGNASCSLPDGSITTCGPYFGSHCTGPNLAPRSSAAPAPQTCAVEARDLMDLFASVAPGGDRTIPALE